MADIIGNVTLIHTYDTAVYHQFLTTVKASLHTFQQNEQNCTAPYPMEMCCSDGRGGEKERIQTRLGQRTSPEEHKKAGTEPHPQRRTVPRAIQRYSDTAMWCCVAHRMGVGQMEREDFLPSTG